MAYYSANCLRETVSIVLYRFVLVSFDNINRYDIAIILLTHTHIHNIHNTFEVRGQLKFVCKVS